MVFVCLTLGRLGCFLGSVVCFCLSVFFFWFGVCSLFLLCSASWFCWGCVGVTYEVSVSRDAFDIFWGGCGWWVVGLTWCVSCFCFCLVYCSLWFLSRYSYIFFMVFGDPLPWVVSAGVVDVF